MAVHIYIVEDDKNIREIEMFSFEKQRICGGGV